MAQCLLDSLCKLPAGSEVTFWSDRLCESRSCSGAGKGMRRIGRVAVIQFPINQVGQPVSFKDTHYARVSTSCFPEQHSSVIKLEFRIRPFRFVYLSIRFELTGKRGLIVGLPSKLRTLFNYQKGYINLFQGDHL